MKLLEIRDELLRGKSIYDMDLRVTFYARVSTDKDAQLNSLDNQIFYYEKKIQGQSNWTFVPGYVDEGISGKSAENRVSFMRMIQDAMSGRFDLILTKEISRFSRNTLDSLKYTQQLYAKGVGIFFEADNINTLEPDSELRLTIMTSIAQEEVRKLSERLRFGYKRSIEKGRVLGQTNLLGYDKEDCKLKVNEEEAAIVKRIFEIYADGKLGVRALLRQLQNEGFAVNPQTGRFLSLATIGNIIQNPKYKGYYCARKSISVDFRNSQRIRQNEKDWIVYRDENIPAIVSEEMWDTANRIYKQRGAKAKTNAPASQNRYPFSGKIVCGEHDTSYHRHVYKSKKQGEQEVWNCKLYRLKGKTEGCDSPTLYTKELVEILYDTYQTVYRQRDTVVDELMTLYESVGEHDYVEDVQRAENAIVSIEAKKDRLLELLMDGIVSKEEFKDRNDRFNGEIVVHREAIEAARMAREKSLDNRRNLNKIRRALEMEAADREHYVFEMSHVLLDRITVHKVDGSKRHIRLEIILAVGKTFEAQIDRKKSISLHDIGISQAQVSRLEKTALGRMKKGV